MSFSVSEVRRHASRKSCWIIIDNTVYDVTDFVDLHPGGARILLNYGGRDATHAFAPVHAPDTLTKHLTPQQRLGTVLVAEHKPNHVVATGKPARKGPKLSSILSVSDFERAASDKLPARSFAFFKSGAEDEDSSARNLQSWKTVQFRPRVLRPIPQIDTRRTILGHEFSAPFFICPAGGGKLANPAGEVLLTQAAGRHRVLHWVCNNAGCTIDEMASARADNQTLFWQIYAKSDLEESAKEVRKAIELGYKGFALTVDAIWPGIRERDLRASILEETGPEPEEDCVEDDSEDSEDSEDEQSFTRGPTVKRPPVCVEFDWIKAVGWLRTITDAPLAIKGIQCWQDAVRCMDFDNAHPWLSNHGGRQLDGAPTALDTLVDIHRNCPRVLEDREVIVDGGVTRGADIVKAIALGAQAVGLGRPFLFSLVYGTAGVSKAIRILQHEVETTMALLGVTSLEQLDPSYIGSDHLISPSLTSPEDVSAGVLSRVQLPRATTDTADERVYVGEASASFLYFLRTALKPFVGQTRFTDGEGYGISPTNEVELVIEGSFHLSTEQVHILLESYYEATSGLLDLFAADEIDVLIEQRVRPQSLGSSSPPVTTPSVNRLDIAALDIALAIGAQYSAAAKADTRIENNLFFSARRTAFEGMLKRTSLGTVRLFLLMAFYMLGACQRSTAAMDLAIATKAAVMLGLHHASSRQQAVDDRRLRIWESLRIFDVLASFILGQSQSLPTTHREHFDVEKLNGSQLWFGKAAISAMSQGCTLIENVVHTLKNGGILHVPTAEKLLGQLRQWTRSLPEALRKFSFEDEPNLEPANRQLLIGNIHIACLYYFAVLLVTRPYLVAYLMSRLRGKAPDHLIDDPDAASDLRIKNNKVSKLAQVCVSSACYMCETLQKLKLSNFRFGNLCLIQAWLFGSGLVLGFSMFAGEPRQDIQDAFAACREVLGAMSETCLQARTYLDILASFHEAVRKYHQRVAMQVRDTVHNYMDQVLMVEVPQALNRTGPSPLDWEAIMAATNDLPADRTDNTAIADFQIQWTDLDLQIVDDYLNLDLGPFQALFCSGE
ncbi:FMN-dependent dehydrogenase-domain-containing protein [Microdochium trichocladiopsis]|uniref:FMN-dependent dehydrogenase-domain-containing protein n=1 Tax=Microdochium trichocladiopsis TaxID=1682393 RepID=A0A9P8YFB6_9PEZI|nr:FMN-dependent dehydrogenase-domain-containing protein [Microdochium trichocladiopsis]KAH7035967.1 FMN-dependent dehydrogenase-domain-containing protein [Microdochium trichocladiopsis]